MKKQTPLSLVGSTPTDCRPPPRLGTAGKALWDSITSEYDISDAGGIAILSQICAAQDRASALACQVDIDGPTIMIRGALREHPALKAELANRAFITRNIQRLGLNVEVVRPVGRPPGWSG